MYCDRRTTHVYSTHSLEYTCVVTVCGICNALILILNSWQLTQAIHYYCTPTIQIYRDVPTVVSSGWDQPPLR